MSASDSRVSAMQDTQDAAGPLFDGDDGDETVEEQLSEEEMERLPRLPAHIPIAAYLIALIEFAERLSYWGCVALYTNFLQFELPKGSSTGAGGPDGQSGALGLGQERTSAIILLTTFASSLTPLFGAYIADSFYGRFKTICIGVGVMLVGHLLLMLAAIPPLIVKPSASLTFFIPAILGMGTGAGLLKPCISPLIAEQADPNVKVQHDKEGRPFLADPQLTNTRLFMYFYWIVNIGSLIGQLLMPFCERRSGFLWAFSIPTAVFLCCPLVLWFGRNLYRKIPPQGSILTKVWYDWRNTDNEHLTQVTDNRLPSNLHKQRPEEEASLLGKSDQSSKSSSLQEVSTGFRACLPLWFLAFFWLCHSQGSNLVSQAATMTLHGLPNDAIRVVNPITLSISIPVCDNYVFPFLLAKGYRFSLLKKMLLGFIFASVGMLWAAVVQHAIYRTSPCGTGAADCRDPISGRRLHAPISVWWQLPTWILIALGEMLTMPTGMNYAFEKSPISMRSLASAIFWMAAAVASLLGEALNVLTREGLLVINYLTMSAIAATCAGVFWLCFRARDKEDCTADTFSAPNTGGD